MATSKNCDSSRNNASYASEDDFHQSNTLFSHSSIQEKKRTVSTNPLVEGGSTVVTNPKHIKRQPFPLVSFHNVSIVPEILHVSKLIHSRYSFSNNTLRIGKSPILITDSFLLMTIKYFIRGQAVYLDYMSPTPVFKSIVPTIALSNPMLLKAMAACGAYSMGRTFPNMEVLPLAESYYKEANSLLCSHLQSKNRDLEICVVTALLITIYELSQGVTHDMKSHIIGIKTLIEQLPYTIDENTNELRFDSVICQASFWVLLHCDINTAFLLRSIPLWNPNDWGPAVGISRNEYSNNNPSEKNNSSPDYDRDTATNSIPSTTKSHDDSFQTPHYWYRRVLYLLYRIVTLRSLGYDPTLTSQTLSTRTYSQSRQNLVDELTQFTNKLPSHMRPMFNFDTQYHSPVGNDGCIFNNTQGSMAKPDTIKNSISPNVTSFSSSIMKDHLKNVSNGTSPMTTSSFLLDSTKDNDHQFFSNSYSEPKDPPVFPKTFYSDPLFAIINVYVTSGFLSLHSMKSVSGSNIFPSDSTGNLNRLSNGYTHNLRAADDPNTSNASGILSAPLASPFDPMRTALTSQDCILYARQVVGVITSAPNYSVGSMTAWCLLFIPPYIYDNYEREYILSYVESLCGIGWSIDKIKLHIRNEWNRK